MNTKAKANSVITHVVGELYRDEKGRYCRAITFHVLGAGSILMKMDKLANEVIERAAVHGMIQRISDAAAISRDPETGKPASAQDKFDAMSRLVAHYESGTAEWSRKPVAGEREKGGLLFKALCQMSPSKSPEEIRAWMGTKTKKELALISRTEKVATVIATLRPATGEVDLSELGL